MQNFGGGIAVTLIGRREGWFVYQNDVGNIRGRRASACIRYDSMLE